MYQRCLLVDQLSFVQKFTNVPVVAPDLPVWARLHHLWKTWAGLGASPKVTRILREANTLPFRIQPNFTSLPIIISGYMHPVRDSCLIETLHALMQNNAVELVRTQVSLGFFNTLFLGLTSTTVDIYLGPQYFEQSSKDSDIQNGNFKDEPGEWVTSIDFS